MNVRIWSRRGAMSFVAAPLVAAALVSGSAALAQTHPSGPGQSSTTSAGGGSRMSYEGHSNGMRSTAPAAMNGPDAQRGFVPQTAAGMQSGRIADHAFSDSIHQYHDAHFTTAFDPARARDAQANPGYWRSYWSGMRWTTFQGHHGFWYGARGTRTFITEIEPGSCAYWNGYIWVPWTPPMSPYRCPY